MARAPKLLVCGLFVGSALAACDTGAEMDTGPAGACADEERAMEYQAGLQVESDDGAFTVTLLSSEPGPPVRAKNVFTLGVDYVGEAGEGAEYTVEPFMPDHGHGSALAPEIVDNGDGTMTVSKIDLFMAGFWEVRVISTWADPAGAADGGAMIEDRAVFGFCVE